MTDVREVLKEIPADLPYQDWIRTAAALKNAGQPFEVFDEWSKTCPEKYDAKACEKTWDSVGGPDHPEITVKTLYYLRVKYGKPAIPAPSAPLACPETDEELLKQRAVLLALLFAEDENVELAVPRSGTEKIPDRPGIIEPWPEALEELQKWAVNNGAWFIINSVKLPLQGKATGDDDISAFRYALVEVDEGTLEEQWSAMTNLPVIPPIVAVVWSGGKSAHAIVKVDAASREEYDERARTLYKYCSEHGVKVDSANKNPARLTRLAGVIRGSGKQYLLSKAFGAQDWESFFAQIAPEDLDRRAVTSPINGQNGGRPQLDTKAYADRFMAELEGRGGKLVFWKGTPYLYEKGWKMLPDKELDGSLSRFLQEECPQKTRISKSLVTDVRTCLEANFISSSDCPEQPYLIKKNESIPDCMIFANCAVRIEDLMTHELEKCPKIQKSSDLFGEDDVDYDFDPTATCPKWEKAVKAWFPEEEEQKMFQKSLGYFISRSTRLNCAFFWYGEAGTGKSTAAEIVRALMGENRCCSVPWDRLNNRFNTAALTTHYMNILEELPTGGATRGQKGLESLLKTATDGGVIQAELKGVNPEWAKVKARFLSCTNEMPKFGDASNGIWDRLVLQEFTQKIRATDTQKVNYADELCKELPGIFNWAVQGMKELADCKRFPLSPDSEELLADLRKRCDLENSFVREKFTQAMGHDIPLRKVMAAYDEYVQTYNGVPKTQDAVKAALQRVFPYVKFKRTRVFQWGQVSAVVNLMFRDDDDEFPLYPGFLQQGGSPIAPEPEQAAVRAAEKSSSVDRGEPDLPAEEEQPELF